jgi:hypothetical protein
MGTNKITGLGTPTTDTDASTKAYVDSVAQGLDTKASVVAGTTANITLSGTQTVDGVVLVAADRVLVKNQTDPAENGIYLCAAGAWTRTTDMDTWAEVPGAYVFIEGGTTLADTGWVCTSNAGGTIGTTAITWAQFSSSGSYTAGTGLTLTGSAFSVNASQTQITAVGTVTAGVWQGTAIGASYVDTLNQNTTGYAATVSGAAQGNITSVGTLTALAVTGNITSGNVQGTLLSGTTVSVTGVITGASVVGGVITGTSSSVTGIVTGASVVGGVITGSSASVTGIVTGASVVGGVITGTSSSVTGIVTGASVVGGVITGSSASVTGIVTGASVVGGVITGTTVSTTGTVTGGNLDTAGAITGASSSVTGIVTGASVVGGVITGTSASVTGNITGSYILGNGSQLTGIAASSYGNANVAANLAAFGSNPISTTGNITAGNISATGIAGTLSTASQPNITSVGTLTSVVTSGAVVINDSRIQRTIATTTSTSADQTISSITINADPNFGNSVAVRYLIKGYTAIGGRFSVATIQAIVDVATPSIEWVVYGQVGIGSTTGSGFGFSLSAGVLALTVTPASSNSTTWTVQAQLV